MKHNFISRRLRTLVAALALSALGSTAAQAGVVKVWGERFDLNVINNFYNGLTGHSSSIATGTLDTVNLSGVNLLWAVQPADAYTTAELTTMANFLAGGGRIAFMGENGGYLPSENARINAALTALGSTISIYVNELLDPSYSSASVDDGQILSHPLTTGVKTYRYGAFAPLSISGTAQALMLGEALFKGSPSIMMAYQNIGPGSVFVITDQNVWDDAPTWDSFDNDFDNERMFENLLSGNTGAPPVGGGNTVPAPATLGLLGASLVALSALRRRDKV